MRESEKQKLAEHYLDLYQIAYSMLHEQSEAEDAVQESLARTFAQPFVQQPLFYCVRVLRNYCLDRLNDEYEVPGNLDTMPMPEEAPIQRLFQARFELLAEARNDLPQRTNQMLDMHYEEGLSVAEIAERLGVSIGTVRKLFKKAYRQIRRKIIMAEIKI